MATSTSPASTSPRGVDTRQRARRAVTVVAAGGRVQLSARRRRRRARGRHGTWPGGARRCAPPRARPRTGVEPSSARRSRPADDVGRRADGGQLPGQRVEVGGCRADRGTGTAGHCARRRTRSIGPTMSRSTWSKAASTSACRRRPSSPWACSRERGPALSSGSTMPPLRVLAPQPRSSRVEHGDRAAAPGQLRGRRQPAVAAARRRRRRRWRGGPRGVTACGDGRVLPQHARLVSRAERRDHRRRCY